MNAAGQTVVSGLGALYISLSEEAIFLNTIGAILIVLAVVLPCILGCQQFRRGLPTEGELGV